MSKEFELIAFSDRLCAALRGCGNPVVVGLDPRIESLPAGLLDPSNADDPNAISEAFQQFCCGIVDVVANRVAVVKPQAAFFELYGPPGMKALYEVISHARKNGLIVILDGKRNDIGSTATAYAKAYLGESSSWGADALTVSPYLGDDSLKPFVDVVGESASGIFVLVKTSNPGGGMLQDLKCDNKHIYEYVASHVESLADATAGSCGYGAVGAVVGATYPEQLQALRAKMPHSWFLVPGFGAQGGGARDVAAAFDDNGLGAVINSSRAIIFAHQRPEYRERFSDQRWQDAVDAATLDMIQQLKIDTPAGKLAKTEN